MNKPPPLNGCYRRNPSVKALQLQGLINQGSALHQKRVLDGFFRDYIGFTAQDLDLV